MLRGEPKTSDMEVRRGFDGELDALGVVRFGESKLLLLLPACPNHMSRDSDGLRSRVRDSDGLRSKDIFTAVPNLQPTRSARAGSKALRTIKNGCGCRRVHATNTPGPGAEVLFWCVMRDATPRVQVTLTRVQGSACLQGT
jgi:hypothetical protein